MRGLTAEEYAALEVVAARRGATTGEALPITDPAEMSVREELEQQGRVWWEEFELGWMSRPTPQGLLALRLWPQVRQHFESQP